MDLCFLNPVMNISFMNTSCCHVVEKIKHYFNLKFLVQNFEADLPFVGDMDFYIRNNEWTVLSFPARRNVAFYKCCPEPFPDVTFYLKIRRKPLFYILSVLFPCMLTSSVAILAFLLPPESGEKVSLNVTILLSLTVFLLMVSDQLPASSDHFPYVGETYRA